MKTNQTTKVESKGKLETTFRAGKITASVFSKEVEKDGKKYTAYSIKICKSYTLDDGKTWNETNNYNVDELVKVQLVTNKAIEFMLLKE